MLVWDGTEVSTPSLDDVPSARRVILRMAATALVVLVLVALGGVVAASRLAERDAIHSGADIVGLLADAVVQPHVTDAVVAGDPAALAELDAAVRRGVRRTFGGLGGGVGIPVDPTEFLALGKVSTVPFPDCRRIIDH